jgi:hypothetical protein
MTIHFRKRAFYKKLSTSKISLVCKRAQNNESGDNDSVSALDSVDENVSEVCSSDSDNEIDDNRELYRRNGTSYSEETGGK